MVTGVAACRCSFFGSAPSGGCQRGSGLIIQPVPKRPRRMAQRAAGRVHQTDFRSMCNLLDADFA